MLLSRMNRQRFEITPLKYCKTQLSNDFFRIIAKMIVSIGLIYGLIFGVNYFHFETDEGFRATFQIFIGVVSIEMTWNELT